MNEHQNLVTAVEASGVDVNWAVSQDVIKDELLRLCDLYYSSFGMKRSCKDCNIICDGKVSPLSYLRQHGVINWGPLRNLVRSQISYSLEKPRAIERAGFEPYNVEHEDELLKVEILGLKRKLHKDTATKEIELLKATVAVLQGKPRSEVRSRDPDGYNTWRSTRAVMLQNQMLKLQLAMAEHLLEQEKERKEAEEVDEDDSYEGGKLKGGKLKKARLE